MGVENISKLIPCYCSRALDTRNVSWAHSYPNFPIFCIAPVATRTQRSFGQTICVRTACTISIHSKATSPTILEEAVNVPTLPGMMVLKVLAVFDNKLSWFCCLFIIAAQSREQNSHWHPLYQNLIQCYYKWGCGGVWKLCWDGV